jgi:hypothetical protein
MLLQMNKNCPNFDPMMFGAALWLCLHCAALRYPDKPTAMDKKHFCDFYKSVQYIIPCDGCQIGYQKMLNITKFGAKDLKSRETLFAWTVKIHNMVNQRIGKPIKGDADYWMPKYMALAQK